MPTEGASAETPSRSLADRITTASGDPISTTTISTVTSNATSKGDVPTVEEVKPTSWAEEVASPVAPAPAPEMKGTDEKKEDATAEKVPDAQLDGAGLTQGGSDLREPDYSVDVKLSDMQADPNNPLYSMKSFEQLGLYVAEFLSLVCGRTGQELTGGGE